MRYFTVSMTFVMLCLTISAFGQGYKDLVNIAPDATVETDGADIPVENVNDNNFDTRWNAKNDDTDTWIKFTWKTAQKINRVHTTEYRSRIRGHTIEYGENFEEVKDLKMKPEDANALPNHPGNQQKPLVVPDHILTFKTVNTKILRYHITKTSGRSDEPTLFEVEIFFDPELDPTPVDPIGSLTTTWAKLKTQNSIDR